MPQVADFDTNFFYDDEIKLNIENFKERAIFLKTLWNFQKEMIFKNIMSITRNCKVAKESIFWGMLKYSS